MLRKKRVYKMNLKNQNVLVLVVLLLLISQLVGCWEKNKQRKSSIETSLEPFLKVLEEDDLSGMTLKIYALDEGMLSRIYTIDELIQRAKEKDHCQEIIIDNATLKEFLPTLSQIRAENIELAKGMGRGNFSTCYIFETDKQLLTLAVGGCNKEPYKFRDNEIELTVFLNGYEVKVNDTLYNVLESLYSLKEKG